MKTKTKSILIHSTPEKVFAQMRGYFAIRDSFQEKRVHRVIAYDVMLGFFACITARRGKVAAYFIKGFVGLRLSFVLNAFANVIMKRDMYSQWSIAQGIHVMGCKTPYQFLFKLKEYKRYAASGNVAGYSTNHLESLQLKFP